MFFILSLVGNASSLYTLLLKVRHSTPLLPTTTRITTATARTVGKWTCSSAMSWPSWVMYSGSLHCGLPCPWVERRKQSPERSRVQETEKLRSGPRSHLESVLMSITLHLPARLLTLQRSPVRQFRLARELPAPRAQAPSTRCLQIPFEAIPASDLDQATRIQWSPAEPNPHSQSFILHVDNSGPSFRTLRKCINTNTTTTKPAVSSGHRANRRCPSL